MAFKGLPQRMLAAVDVRDPIVRPPVAEGGRKEATEYVDVSPGFCKQKGAGRGQRGTVVAVPGQEFGGGTQGEEH